jgi:hypothetical protein
MKSLKVLLLFALFTSFSCSEDQEDTSIKPQQGSVSIALSNGGGFVIENLNAIISNHYGTDNTTDVSITGTAGSSGSIVITIIDNDGSFKALSKESSFPIGDTSKTYFATVKYASDNFNLDAGAGTITITSYTEFKDEKYSVLDATFSAAGNSNTMTSSILGLILSCSECD